LEAENLDWIALRDELAEGRGGSSKKGPVTTAGITQGALSCRADGHFSLIVYQENSALRNMEQVLNEGRYPFENIREGFGSN
jgi:hypothetical protein